MATRDGKSVQPRGTPTPSLLLIVDRRRRLFIQHQPPLHSNLRSSFDLPRSVDENSYISKVPLVLMTMKDADIISTSMLVVAFLDLVVNVHFWIVDTTEKLRRAGSRPSARSAGWRTYLPLRSRHGRRG
ncbi:hypothetical protein G6O67_008106 [Ophiocordyceps sinensis]|uniref:Uncharacterized protein n=1 Tax=Ophiocordyceps sinensis TaxID=72228 RepID=A0A8H4LSM4_9HYPO|nr:hypothetical protein G6O67_008106 [Ophiocordyceps sinensis]